MPPRPRRHARPLSPANVAARMSRPSRPRISVVVPTRDRPLALARCLDALDAQSVADQLEILVVDDGSVAASVVSSVVARHARARLIRLPGAGPAGARNAGGRAARGSVLCFTDDDCVPLHDWAEELAEVVQHGADAAAGTTMAGRGALAEASELVAHAPAHSSSGGAVDLQFAPSNNLAVAKAVFESAPFDESYPHAAGEDREWCARVLASGHVLRSAPRAVLVHDQELTPRTFLRQQLRYGDGAYRFRRRGSDRRPLESPGFYLALVERAFTRGIRVGLLVCAAQLATAAGFVGAWARERRADSSVRARLDASSTSRLRALRARLARPRRT